MLTIKEVRRALKQRCILEVERRTGIHRNTLYRLRDGTQSPKAATIEALAKYLRAA